MIKSKGTSMPSLRAAIQYLIFTAGGGKTTELLRRFLKWMADGVPPDLAAFIAFQNLDVKRIVNRLGGAGKDYPHVQTLHSLAKFHAQIESTRIYNERWHRKFCNTLGVKYSRPSSTLFDRSDDDQEHEVGLALHIWHTSRHLLGYDLDEDQIDPDRAYDKAPDHKKKSISRSEFRRLIRRYIDFKKEYGLADFTDFFFRALQTKEPVGITHAAFDEVQDFTPLMWRYLMRIAEEATEVVCAGDPDQSIFSFAGVEDALYKSLLENSDDVQEDFRTKRCAIEIMAYAEAALRSVPDRRLQPASHHGHVRLLRSKDPILPDGKTCAVLSRNRNHLKGIGQRLLRAGVAYTGEGSPLTEEFCGAMWAFYRGLKGEALTYEEHRSYSKILQRTHPWALPSRPDQVWRSMIDRYPNTVAFTPGLLGLEDSLVKSLYKDPLAILRADPTSGKDYISEAEFGFVSVLFDQVGFKLFERPPLYHLSTIHAAKGGEWDWVNVCHQALASCSDLGALNKDEERRLKFVAMTRARTGLYSFGTKKASYDYLSFL